MTWKLAFFSAVLAVFTPAAAYAATFTVTSTVDAGDANVGDGICDDGTGACTLRAAVQESNVFAGADDVILPAGTYTLALGALDLMYPEDGGGIRLLGAGAAITTIDANGVGLALNAWGAGSLEVAGMTITRSSGIYVYETPFTMRDSEFVGNHGGLDIDEGTDLTLMRTTLRDNDGGVYCGTSARCTIQETILENSGRLTIGLDAYADVANSVFSGATTVGDGGAIQLQTDSGADIRDTLITGNTAKNGGAICICSDAGINLTNVTISGNRALDHGGGIYVSHDVIDVTTYGFDHVTIAENVADYDADGVGDGGGIHGADWVGGVGSPTTNFPDISRSILAANVDTGDEAPNCSGRWESQGYNLFSDLEGCTIEGDTSTDTVTPFPQIGPAVGLTHPTMAGSVAIDAIPSSQCSVSGDQRGVTRPQGSACDIGAYESVCASEPRGPGCRVAPKTAIAITDDAAEAKDKLTWKWVKGDATLLGDFGAPATSTEYSLCIHDTAAGVPSLAAALRVPPADLWGTSGTSGYRYREKEGTRDGVTSIKLRAGIDGQPRLQVKAQGANVRLPVPFSAFQSFEQDPSVSVQLLTSDGACWDSRFEVGDTSKNNGSMFKAR